MIDGPEIVNDSAANRLRSGCHSAKSLAHLWDHRVVVFLTVCVGSDPATESDLVVKWQQTLAFMQDRPYLQVPASIVTLVPTKLADRPFADRGVPDFRIAAEQRTLNAMAEEVRRLDDEATRIRWSFVPAVGSFSTLMTSIFVHAGLMHLLGNMAFLFATGPVVEDAFGRPLFAALYFVGGIAATVGYAMRHSDSVIPMMGASGAIAAVMGAYLVRFLGSRIEFIWIPIIFLPRLHMRFFIPAFVVLPLWLLAQFAAVPFEGESGGVAVTAHITGFLYGVVFALTVKFTKALMTKQPQPAIADALRREVDLAFEAKDDHALDAAATRLLGRLIDEKRDDAARNLIQDLAGAGIEKVLPLFLSRAAVYAEKRGDRRVAVGLYRKLSVLDPSGPRSLSSLMKLGSLLKSEGDISGAREALLRARAHRACTPECIRKIDAALGQVDAGTGDLAEETPWT